MVKMNHFPHPYQCFIYTRLALLQTMRAGKSLPFGITPNRRFYSMLCQTISQEHLGAPIYWSPAPIYWSPKILFSTFWKGMKRKSYDKTRFCVSHEGLSNGLGTFGLTWYMFENKTKNMFLIWRGSNVLEPRLQYNGARAPIYWSHQFFFPIRQ